MYDLTDDINWPDGELDKETPSPSDDFDFNYSQTKLDRYENRD